MSGFKLLTIAVAVLLFISCQAHSGLRREHGKNKNQKHLEKSSSDSSVTSQLQTKFDFLAFITACFSCSCTDEYEEDVPNEPEFTAEELTAALNALSLQLADGKPPVVVFGIGGVVSILNLQTRAKTHDIDCYFSVEQFAAQEDPNMNPMKTGENQRAMQQRLYDAVKVVAGSKDILRGEAGKLKEPWLNLGPQGWMLAPGLTDYAKEAASPGAIYTSANGQLKLLLPPWVVSLAMKIDAWRHQKDFVDAVALMNKVDPDQTWTGDQTYNYIKPIIVGAKLQVTQENVIKRVASIRSGNFVP